MFNQKGSKKSFEISIENCEFAKNFHYFISVEIEGETIRRRTNVSMQVANP